MHFNILLVEPGDENSGRKTNLFRHVEIDRYNKAFTRGRGRMLMMSVCLKRLDRMVEWLPYPLAPSLIRGESYFSLSRIY